MRMRLAIPVLTTPVLALVAAGALAATPAGAVAPRVLRVGAPPKTVTAGARLALAVTARPATARLTVSLSRDRRRDRRDIAVGSARPRKGRIAVTVPPRTKPAAYHVLVCAGKRCVATARTVRVVAKGNPPTPLPAPGPGPGPGTPSDPGIVLAPPGTAPTTVHPTLDADPTHAKSATVGAAGGDLTATGADGSTYTLSIPSGALLSAETITLTPVASIPDLPFTTAPAAAVQIGPDGLSLQIPATLTIVPAHPAPLAEQTGFGWHGTGTDFHLTSLGTDPTKIVLTLWHFSGAGVGGATAQQRAAQAQHVPQTPADALDQQLAQTRDAIRRGDQAAGTAAEADAFVTAFDTIVLPAVQAAAQDGSRLADAVSALLSWAHDTAVLTDPDSADPRIKTRFDQVGPLLGALLDAAYGKAKQACDAGDPSQVARLFQIAHLQAILGMTAAPAMDDAKTCTTFTLSIDDAIHWTELQVWLDADWHLDQLPLAPDAQGQIQSTGTLQDGGWSVAPQWDSTCTTQQTGSSAGPPVTVKLDLDSNWRTEKDAQGVNRDVVGPVKLTLHVIDGRPTNNFNVNCVDSQGHPEPPIPFQFPTWTMAWMGRQANLDTTTGSFDLTFTATGTSPILDVTLPDHQVVDAATIDDTLHIVLEHASS